MLCEYTLLVAMAPPIASKETNTADINGGIFLLYNHRPPLHHVGVTNVGLSMLEEITT
jgi:hypothetical protein